MINLIIDWAIKQRLVVLALCALLSFMGYQSIIKTPVDALPDLSDVQVIVKTSYPGQAPKLIEQQITFPLSSGLMAVPGAKAVRGYSFFGDSYIYVLFDDNVDLYWARSRVNEYLTQLQANLPQGAKTALGPDASGVGWVYQYALVDRSGQHDLSQLKSLQDWYLKLALQGVKGVSEVATVGGMERSYQVIVDPAKLAMYRLSLSDVKNAINLGNNEVGGSVLEMAEAEYMVRSTGYLQTLDDFKQLQLGLRSDSSTPLMLKDVATIRLGPSSRRGISDLDGEGEVVGGIVVMRHGENALATINRVKAKLAQLSQGLPKGVELVTTYDRSQLIESSVANLIDKLWQEMLMVALVCFIFVLHARSTLVAVVSIPLSVLLAFMLMNAIGISANIMSLGGIAIAIGAVVDAAIVMLENAHKHLHQFQTKHGRVASSKEHWSIVSSAAKQVGGALFTSLAIITLSFMPVFALEAQEGRLFAPLAYTKTFTMAASCLLAITLVPVLLGYLVKGRLRPEQANPLNRGLTKGYQALLSRLIHYPKTVLVLALVVCASAWYPIKQMGNEFMPELNEGSLMYMPTTLPGISADKASQLLRQTDALIKTVPEVERVFGKVGRAETATDPAPLTMLETTITLKPQDKWRKGMTLESIINELDAAVQVPGLTNAWVQPIKTRIDMLSTGVKTPVGVRISGEDVSVLEQIGEQITTRLQQLDSTRSAFSERAGSGRYIEINPKLAAAARYGLNLEQIHDVVRYAIGGQSIGQSIQGSERYPILMRYPRELRDNLAKLKSLPVVSKEGHYLSLGMLADISIVDGPAMLKSENGQLISWVFVDIHNTTVGDYIEQAQQALQDLALPAKYSFEFAGQYQYMQRVEAKLAQVIPVTLLLILVLLLAHFQKLGPVVLVLASLPLALVGSLWLLQGLGYAFSVAVAVGLIALAGVAVEFGVVMLVYLKQAIGEDQAQYGALSAEQLRAAIVRGACQRIRPKAMTVLTIVFGLLPIMWGAGSGNEVMQKIAAPMLGGMISAPLLSLLVIPCGYYLLTKRTISRVL
ncbi:efflux RND transporter permease subunit [Paraferrimonas sp. SM1919]|uniref:efflux RND transporter permease subunit n=1 Tax=Paraferrimonas sp. SM1919 TaxID=2662263 RepID=UPI0013D0AC4E|nr:CusA/CzcA family heavy metal efflux RND transporter [Paraferrimonas sp. SM1919]